MGSGDEKISVYFPQLELNLEEIRFYKAKKSQVALMLGTKEENLIISETIYQLIVKGLQLAAERQILFSSIQKETTAEKSSIGEFLGDSQPRLKNFFLKCSIPTTAMPNDMDIWQTIFSDLKTMCVS